MKATIIVACLLVFSISFHAQDKGNIENATESDKLINDMTFFFTETLEDSYESNNVYKNFLQDFKEKYNSHINTSVREDFEPFVFNLNVNEERLRNINKSLFLRDNLHYYYLYPEVIYLEQGEDSHNGFIKENANVPYVVMQNMSTKSNVSLLNFIDSYNILLVVDDGFMKNIDSKGLNIVKQLKSLQNATGNIGFINVANILTGEEGQEELNFTITKQLVAVIFWKLLCLQEDIQFHKPPTNS